MKRRSFLKGLFAAVASVRLLGAQATLKEESVIDETAEFSKLGEVMSDYIQEKLCEEGWVRKIIPPGVIA